jgi:two-component system, chemotaxis family, sensor kinase CheA
MTDRAPDNADNGYSAEMEEVWALFAEDGKEALELIEGTLLNLEKRPDDADRIAGLFRGLHNFKGNARMMGLSVIEGLVHQAEDLVALARDEGVQLTEEMIDVLLAVLDQARAMLDHAVAHRRDIDSSQVDPLSSRLAALLAERAPVTGAPGEDEAVERLAGAEDTAGSAVEDALAPILVEQDEKAEVEEDAFDYSGIERIDPASDPEYVRIFLELAQEQLECLRGALDTLSQGRGATPESLLEIQMTLDMLEHAAHQMGYERLPAVLAPFIDAVEALSFRFQGQASADLGSVDQELAGLREMETAVWEEIVALEQKARAMGVDVDLGPPLASPAPPFPPAESASDELHLVFRRQCREQSRAYLTRLGEIADEMEQCLKQLLTDGCELDQESVLAREASATLRALYDHCVLQDVAPLAHLTLLLKELYTRATHARLVANEALLDLTRAYVDRFRAILEAACAGEPVDLADFASLHDRAQDLLCLHAESPISQTARAVLRCLDLPEPFEEVITPENLLDVGRALQAGERLYTVLADLNHDESISEAFYEWIQSAPVRPITNVTVFREEETLFDFLLATVLLPEAVRKALACIDPQGEHLSLDVCRFRPGVDVDHILGESARPPGVYVESAPREPRSAVSSDTLGELMKDVGKLVSTRATLHHVIGQLTDTDEVVATVMRLVERADADRRRLRRELRSVLEMRTADVDALSKLETEMGATLTHIQEIALAMRARPAGDAFAPLQRLAEEAPQRQGKLVHLALEGADVQLDQQSLDILGAPTRQLVWFVIVHGIEKPAHRREVGKPAFGQITVTVSRAVNHVRVIVEDDGRGLDPETIRERGRALGWATDDVSDRRLFQWPLQAGFGPLGGPLTNGERADGPGLDLAEIARSLQAHGGRLALSSEPGRGARFVLQLPLDMVVIDGMVVRVKNVHYVAPTQAIRRIVKPAAEQIVRSAANGDRRMLRLAGDVIPIRPLTGQTQADISSERLFVVVETDGGETALVVDELLGQQQVLIQPLSGHLTDIEGVSGCALLGEGRVSLVLDLSRLL